jgi:6-pyruvoyltetrahydropterin/6-carboxytetrahydropterin synthase
MITVLFSRKFSAAHRLKDDDGPCQRIHGHNYTCTIYIEVLTMHNQMFIIPADKIKDLVDRKYDHKLILEWTDPLGDILERHFPEDWMVFTDLAPTTENLALDIADAVGKAVLEYGEHKAIKVRVQLQETDTIMADVTGTHNWRKE